MMRRCNRYENFMRRKQSCVYIEYWFLPSVRLHNNNLIFWKIFWKHKSLLMGFVHEKAKMTLGNKTARRFSLIPCSSLLAIVFKSGDNVIFRGFRGISDNKISVGTQSAHYLNRNMKLIHISVSLCETDGQRWLEVLQGTGQTEGQVDFNILHPSNVEDVISFIVLWLFFAVVRGQIFFIFFPFQLYLDFVIRFVIVFHEQERQLHYSSAHRHHVLFWHVCN